MGDSNDWYDQPKVSADQSKHIDLKKLDHHLSKIKELWNKKKKVNQTLINRQTIEGEFLSKSERKEQVTYTKSTHFSLGFEEGKII